MEKLLPSFGEWTRKGKRVLALGRLDRWLGEYPRAKPALVFGVSISLVILASFSIELAQRRTMQAAWQADADDIASTLKSHAASDAAYLEATSALAAKMDNLSPLFFRSFVERLAEVSDLNGVVGMGWSEAVSCEQLPALRARMKEDGFPDFQIRSGAGGKADGKECPANAITMLQPMTPANRAMIGMDLHGEGRRAAAMDWARQTRKIAATDSVQLYQDAGRAHSPGLLVFAPVWARDGDKRFLGFAYLSIRTSDFIRAAVSSRLLNSGRVEIFDQGPDGNELIFSSAPSAGQFEQAIEEEVSMFDQTWTLRYAPQSQDGAFSLAFLIPIGGTAFSLLLLAYVLLVQRRNADLQALVEVQVEQEKERVAFVRELNHRVNNSLTNVTSLISLTRRHAADVDSFADTLLQRVQALAAGHALFSGSNWGPTDLRALVAAQLASGNPGVGQAVIEGPSAVISPNEAMSVGLALHELATNARRYGALSTEEGTVQVSWRILDDEQIELDWQESGGPEVKLPIRRGLGLDLIERILASEFARPVSIDFNPEGIRCRIYIRTRKQRDFQLRN